MSGLTRKTPPRVLHPRPHAAHVSTWSTMKVKEEVHPTDRIQSSSRLTQTTSTTIRTTTTQRHESTRTTTNVSYYCTKSYSSSLWRIGIVNINLLQVPDEPPDESEDLTEADAALYDTEPDVEMRVSRTVNIDHFALSSLFSRAISLKKYLTRIGRSN